MTRWWWWWWLCPLCARPTPSVHLKQDTPSSTLLLVKFIWSYMLWTHNGRINRFLTSNEQYFSYIYGSMTGTGIAHINEKSDNTEIKDNYWYTGMWGKFTLQRTTTCIPLSRNESGRFGALNLIQPTISLEMPVPSQGHYGFHSFPVVDWFCLFIYLWVLTFPL